MLGILGGFYALYLETNKEHVELFGPFHMLGVLILKVHFNPAEGGIP